MMGHGIEHFPSHPAPPTRPHPSAGRILIVDDEAMIREILSEKLRGEGYHCFVACDAREALVRLMENAPDLVLLDMMMPGKSGIELLPELKASDPHLSVIMVTAVQDVDTAIETMKLGADDYVLKPFKLTEIVVSVQRALEKRRLAVSHVDYQINLENEVAERTRELETLNGVSKTLSRTLDLEAISGAALDQVMDLTEVGCGGIYLLDDEFAELSLAVARGMTKAAEGCVRKIPVGTGVIGYVAECGKPKVFDEIGTTFEKDRPCVLEEGIRAFAAIPMRSKDRVVGVLALGSHSYRRFSDREIELLTAIGNQAGMAIENALLYRKERREAELSATLLEIGRNLSASLNEEALPRWIVEAVNKLVSADSVSVWFLDPVQGDCVLKYSGDQDPIYPPGSRQKLGSGIAGWSAVHGEAFLLCNRGSGTGPIRYHPPETSISSYISIPLAVNGKILGVLLVARTGDDVPFRNRDMAPLLLLAGQAGVVIENARLFQEVRRQTEAVRNANFEAIKALAETLETKDAYTRGHSDRALRCAVAVGRKFALSNDQMNWLKYAAIFHDIGKIGIPDSILNKPGPLTAEEYEVIKSHPKKGADILGQITFLAPVVPMVLYHQERYDGKGYPAGLKGEEIPIQSRIVAVLDAYDAMTSDRIYRKSPGKAYAISELKKYAGTQFDPNVVQAFLEVLEENGE